jgi:hypothetical protein
MARTTPPTFCASSPARHVCAWMCQNISSHFKKPLPRKRLASSLRSHPRRCQLRSRIQRHQGRRPPRLTESHSLADVRKGDVVAFDHAHVMICTGFDAKGQPTFIGSNKREQGRQPEDLGRPAHQVVQPELGDAEGVGEQRGDHAPQLEAEAVAAAGYHLPFFQARPRRSRANAAAHFLWTQLHHVMKFQNLPRGVGSRDF